MAETDEKVIKQLRSVEKGELIRKDIDAFINSTFQDILFSQPLFDTVDHLEKNRKKFVEEHVSSTIYGLDREITYFAKRLAIVFPAYTNWFDIPTYSIPLKMRKHSPTFEELHERYKNYAILLFTGGKPISPAQVFLCWFDQVRLEHVNFNSSKRNENRVDINLRELGEYKSFAYSGFLSGRTKDWLIGKIREKVMGPL
jgi:hypothetical protein